MRGCIVLIILSITLTKSQEKTKKMICYECKNCTKLPKNFQERGYGCTSCYTMLKDFQNGTFTLDRGCLHEKCEEKFVNGDGYTGSIDCCETDLCNHRWLITTTARPPILQTTETKTNTTTNSTASANTSVTTSTTSNSNATNVTTTEIPVQGKNIPCYECKNCPTVSNVTEKLQHCLSCYAMLKYYKNDSYNFDRGCMREDCVAKSVNGSDYIGNIECCKTELCNGFPLRDSTTTLPSSNSTDGISQSTTTPKNSVSISPDETTNSTSKIQEGQPDTSADIFCNIPIVISIVAMVHFVPNFL